MRKHMVHQLGEGQYVGRTACLAVPPRMIEPSAYRKLQVLSGKLTEATDRGYQAGQQ